MCLKYQQGALVRTGRYALLGAFSSLVYFASLTLPSQGQTEPSITSLGFTLDGDLQVIASLPSGYRHAVLAVIPEGADPTVWQPLASGPLTGEAGEVRFVLPRQGNGALMRVELGVSTVVPPTPYTGLDHVSASYSDGGFYIGDSSKAVHLLNRIAYGPNPIDYNKVLTMGTSSFINEQLAPETIDESGNVALNDRVGELFYSYLPYTGDLLVAPGQQCRFFRGTVEPTPGLGGEATIDWAQPGFDDAAWETGPTGLGYGDNDDATVLSDMPFDDSVIPVQQGYLSVYLRQTFEVPDVAAIDNLLLRIRYDDGFVAYLNGTRVADFNVSGTPPTFDTPADDAGGNVDDSDPFEFDLTALKGHLVQGTNVLAVQLHNAGTSSSDASVIPSLVNVSPSPYPAIKGVKELQHLVHLRGIYSAKQLQAVLAEFWENHFTTDYDKVRDYFEDLESFEALVESGVDEDLVELQAATEAGVVEYDEYQFFYDNALGNFGDMLLYSATSPAMLIYLDNILNLADAPNENYAREILELHTYGVDNGYTQFDIEELSRCFTGWTVRKVKLEHQQPFPQSATNPPTTASMTVDSETAVVDEGAVWQFFRGTAEPSPGAGGEATTDWAQPAFPATGWESGASGIGYDDGDDNTILNDMRFIEGVQPGYASFYMRHEFAVTIADYGALLFEIDYDDGYVAYLNGVEIARSNSMSDNGTPPAFNELSGSHEAGNPVRIDLEPWAHLINEAPATNVLAVQIHNTTLDSSDASAIPRILGVNYTADSIAETDPNGVWTFRFDPDQHDVGQKDLFGGTPYEMTIPAGRTGIDGVNDALDVINALVENLPTKQFICVKLVNRFVSDEITLASYQARTAPEWLLTLVDDAIAAWSSTTPQGNIATVMTAILDPSNQASGFWVEGAQRSKVKSPIEYVNSGFRALEADVTSVSLPDRSEDMGMELFQRDDPDGFSEKGSDWIDTLGFLERMKFSQSLGTDRSFSRSAWDIDATLAANAITTPEELIAYFDNLLFDNKLPGIRKTVLLDFANTDDTGAPSPFADLSSFQKTNRLRDLTGLILSTPEFQLQ